MFQKQNILIHLSSVCMLILGFLLCRYAFFALHGMIQIPVLLLFVGLATLLLSFLASAKYFPFFVPAAYLIGFAAGVCFQTNGTDPGGGTTNNLWLIWTSIYIICYATGLIWEYRMQKRRSA